MKTEQIVSKAFIQELKTGLEKRARKIELLKTLYNPKIHTTSIADGNNNSLKNLVKSDNELAKVSWQSVEAYERRNRVTLPELLKVVMTEIGIGRFYRTHFFSSSQELAEPLCCFEEAFIDACLEAEIPKITMEAQGYGIYDAASNSFKITALQEVYQQLGSERDELLTLLLPIDSDGYLVLNRGDNASIAVYDVYDSGNKHIEHRGLEYDIPYYAYCRTTLEEHVEDLFSDSYEDYLISRLNLSSSQI